MHQGTCYFKQYSAIQVQSKVASLHCGDRRLNSITNYNAYCPLILAVYLRNSSGIYLGKTNSDPPCPHRNRTKFNIQNATEEKKNHPNPKVWSIEQIKSREAYSCRRMNHPAAPTKREPFSMLCAGTNFRWDSDNSRTSLRRKS